MQCISYLESHFFAKKIVLSIPQMKIMRATYILSLLFTIILVGCGASKKGQESSNLGEKLEEKNRGQVTLLTKIRQLPGVTLQNGVPVINRTSASVSQYGNSEPLYVLNGQIIGTSFNSVNQLVDNFNIKQVRVLTGSDASFYGTQGAKGVIEITTYQ